MPTLTRFSGSIAHLSGSASDTKLRPLYFTESCASVATGTGASGDVRFMPMRVQRDLRVTGIAINVTIAGGAGETSQIGIYTNSLATGNPARLLYASAFFSTGTGVTGNLIQALPEPMVLVPSIYWLAYLGISASALSTKTAITNSYNFAFLRGAAPVATAGLLMTGQTSLPSLITTSQNTTGNVIKLWLRGGHVNA